MKLGIMQPYFLPNLSHIALILHTDKWIVFDNIQFIRHGWIERNRILKPDGSWQYINVPLVKHSRNTLIKDILIRANENWQEKILSQLTHYKKSAPYYDQAIEFLNGCFIEEFTDIVGLNCFILEKICAHLEIPFDYSVYSQMDLEHDQVNHPGDWALEISKSMNATNYVNPIGGKALFDKKKYANAHIDLNFLNFSPTEYPQKGNSFEPGLSIIDVMMFNSREEIKKMLTNYTIE